MYGIIGIDFIFLKTSQSCCYNIKIKWVCFCLDFFWDPYKNEWEESGFFGYYGDWLSKKIFF